MNKKNSHIQSFPINNIKPINILVLSQIEEGGEAIAISRLLEALDKHSQGQIKLSLIAKTKKKQYLPYIKKGIFIPYSRFRPPFSFIKTLIKDILNIKDAIEKITQDKIPEYILATNYLALPALLLSKLRGNKYLYYFSGIKTPWNKKFWQLDYRQMIVRTLELSSILLASAMITPSKEGESIVKKMLGALGKTKKYFIVPNYVPDVFFQKITNETKSRYSKNILYAGRIAKFKGLENLLAAYTILKKEDKNFVLLFAYPSGSVDEDIFRSLKQKVAKHKLGNSVKFIPDSSTYKLIKLYKKASVLVLPSEIEIAPLSILEAAAATTPAVGTDVGNMKEVLSKIDKGLVLGNNNVETIVKGLKYFFSLSPQRIRKLSKKSVDVARQYSEEKTAKEFFKVLNYESPQ